MIVLAYIGNHAKDTLMVRLGWRLIRLVQRGEFKHVTHTECVLAGNHYTLCTIASASVRDKGVRIKANIALTKGNWLAFDVRELSNEKSRHWFEAHDGEAYNMVGAIATKIPLFRQLALRLAGYFCNWSCLASAGLKYAYKETPSQSIERLIREHGAADITQQFFKDDTA